MRVFGSKDGGYFSCLVKNYLDTIVVGMESLTTGLLRGDLNDDYIFCIDFTLVFIIIFRQFSYIDMLPIICLK